MEYIVVIGMGGVVVAAIVLCVCCFISRYNEILPSSFRTSVQSTRGGMSMRCVCEIELCVIMYIKSSSSDENKDYNCQAEGDLT